MAKYVSFIDILRSYLIRILKLDLDNMDTKVTENKKTAIHLKFSDYYLLKKICFVDLFLG